MTDRWPPCHGMTDLYFPDYKERPEATAERLELCRRICSTCEQIIHCSLTAFQNGEEGIWAGRLHTGSDVPKPNTRRARMRALNQTRKRTP